MTEDEFWAVVDAGTDARPDPDVGDRIGDRLRRSARKVLSTVWLAENQELNGPMLARLQQLTDWSAGATDEELAGFVEQLRAAQNRANNWDLWAAGYLALGGLGDDSFLDFRSWLISHGRDTFERVLATPDDLVELSWDDGQEDFAIAEQWAAAPIEAWEERHEEMPLPSGYDGDDEPAGEPFPEDDPGWFAARFPRLSQRYATD